MIPILYPASEKEFKSNGICRLADCVRFDVTEERNGIYECEFEYPMTGDHFKDIQDGCFVYATHDNSGKPQAFQIYKRSAPIKGIVTFNAWHISYALRDMVVAPFEATSCAQALQKIPANTIGENLFTFWTDKGVAGDYKLKEPRAIRATLGGQQGSILDVYGKGDYEFDMYSVKLYVDRGSDRGVSIRYGKNMADLKQTLDASNIVNGVVPFWSGTDGDGDVVYLPYAVLGRVAKTQDLPLITHELQPILTEAGLEILAQYADLRIGVLDLSGDFEEPPTPAQLEEKARAYMLKSDAYQLKENITVDFVQLWQTEEYKDYASLQRVFLCDTVHIYHERLGINATAKCIKVVYDTLKERYKLMELGEPKTTLNQQIADISRAVIAAETADLPDTAAMQKAIKHATEMITGGLGGYVVIAEGDNGYPEEILIMDTPDKKTAVNVWRFNKGGLGHSHSGYNGPFNDVALTADGQINANMITTGAINAALVDVSNLKAGNIVSGTISDASGKNSWNLDTGVFTTKQGTIGGFEITNDGLSKSNVGTYSTDSVLITPVESKYTSVSTFGNSQSVSLQPGQLVFGANIEQGQAESTSRVFAARGYKTMADPSQGTESVLAFHVWNSMTGKYGNVAIIGDDQNYTSIFQSFCTVDVVAGFRKDDITNTVELTSLYKVGNKSTSQSFTYGGVSSSATIYRQIQTVSFNLNFGGSTFSSATGNDTLFTLPDGYRPIKTEYITGYARTSGTWASATYHPITLYIQTNGQVKVLGNGTNLKTCNYISATATFMTGDTMPA